MGDQKFWQNLGKNLGANKQIPEHRFSLNFVSRRPLGGSLSVQERFPQSPPWPEILGKNPFIYIYISEKIFF